MQPHIFVLKMKKCCIMVRVKDWTCQNSWEPTFGLAISCHFFFCIFKTRIKLTHLIKDLCSIINIALQSLEIKILMECQSSVNNINAITDAVIKVFSQHQVLEKIPAEK